MGLSFYNVAVTSDQKAERLQCGRGGPMQANIQSGLGLEATFRLLEPRDDGQAGGDRELNKLAAEVNAVFAEKAGRLLAAKRKALLRDGVPDAHRLEVTVLLTADGLQLAYDVALPRKEIAPAPRKPLLRRLLGPLWPYPKQDVPDPVRTEAPEKETSARARRPSSRRAS